MCIYKQWDIWIKEYVDDAGLIAFCLILYVLEEDTLLKFLRSLSPDELFFILCVLIRFGFMWTNFRGLNLYRSSNWNFVFDLTKKGSSSYRKFCPSKFIFKWKGKNNVDFKKNLLLEVLGRDPVVGLYERNAYYRRHGHNKNYNSKKVVHNKRL